MAVSFLTAKDAKVSQRAQWRRIRFSQSFDCANRFYWISLPPWELCVTGYFKFLTFRAIALKARLIKAMGVSPWIIYSKLFPGFGRSDANRENKVSPKRMKVNIFTVVFRIPEFNRSWGHKRWLCLFQPPRTPRFRRGRSEDVFGFLNLLIAPIDFTELACHRECFASRVISNFWIYRSWRHKRWLCLF
jgi:hypothetical protein